MAPATPPLAGEADPEARRDVRRAAGAHTSLQRIPGWRGFTSRILPPYMRRSPQVSEVLPLLYLRGLSTGDFREALPALLGEDAAGLSPTTISRLTVGAGGGSSGPAGEPPCRRQSGGRDRGDLGGHDAGARPEVRALLEEALPSAPRFVEERHDRNHRASEDLKGRRPGQARRLTGRALERRVALGIIKRHVATAGLSLLLVKNRNSTQRRVGNVNIVGEL